MINILKCLAGTAIVFLIASAPALVLAAENLPLINTTGQCVCRDKTYYDTNDPCKAVCGDYNINDGVGVMIRFSQIMLGLSGTAALVFFVYGGFIFLFSQGSKEQVAKGKTIIKNAIVGLMMIFLAYTAVAFVMKALGRDENWNQTPTK